MKYLCLIMCFTLCACCPEPEPMTPLDAEMLITELAGLDYIVNVEEDEVSIDGEVVGILDVAQKRSAVITCDPFGWGSEYDWLCTMNGTKGRGLAKNSATPTTADIGTYLESGSEMYPGDITSTTYYNADTYVNALDTHANPAAFFGLTIAAWGPEWSPALEYWCTNDHIPMCIQE